MSFLWDVLIGLGALAALGIAVLIWQVTPVRIRHHNSSPYVARPAEHSAPALRGPEPMHGNRSWYWCGMCHGERCWRCARARMGRL